MYFSLVDIPKSLHSKTDNIFLVLTVLEKDLQNEKKNYNHLFKPLVYDHKRLESEVQIGGRTILLLMCVESVISSTKTC